MALQVSRYRENIGSRGQTQQSLATVPPTQPHCYFLCYACHQTLKSSRNRHTHSGLTRLIRGNTVTVHEHNPSPPTSDHINLIVRLAMAPQAQKGKSRSVYAAKLGHTAAYPNAYLVRSGHRNARRTGSGNADRNSGTRVSRSLYLQCHSYLTFGNSVAVINVAAENGLRQLVLHSKRTKATLIGTRTARLLASSTLNTSNRVSVSW